MKLEQSGLPLSSQERGTEGVRCVRSDLFNTFCNPPTQKTSFPANWWDFTSVIGKNELYFGRFTSAIGKNEVYFGHFTSVMAKSGPGFGSDRKKTGIVRVEPNTESFLDEAEAVVGKP